MRAWAGHYLCPRSIGRLRGFSPRRTRSFRVFSSRLLAFANPGPSCSEKAKASKRAGLRHFDGWHQPVDTFLSAPFFVRPCLLPASPLLTFLCRCLLRRRTREKQPAALFPQHFAVRSHPQVLLPCHKFLCTSCAQGWASSPGSHSSLSAATEIDRERERERESSVWRVILRVGNEVPLPPLRQGYRHVVTCRHSSSAGAAGKQLPGFCVSGLGFREGARGHLSC